MKMTRRELLLNASVAGAAAIGLPACSGNPFAPDKPGDSKPIDQPPPPALKTAQVNLLQLAQSVQTQQCEQWCWAACMSMMFGFYNHPISQASLVAATYGAVVCLPANSTLTIGRDLSRFYVDQRGVPFGSRVVAGYDPMNGVYAINNAMIVDGLTRSNPLLYCNTHHAMVVYSVDYYDAPLGPDVRAVRVIDPWPFSPRSHTLTQLEMAPAHLGGQMTFLAQVQVT